jgi:hypothetical protein
MRVLAKRGQTGRSAHYVLAAKPDINPPNPPAPSGEPNPPETRQTRRRQAPGKDIEASNSSGKGQVAKRKESGATVAKKVHRIKKS